MESREIEQLAHGTGITLVGSVAGNGLNYAVGIVISRLAGASVVGAYYLSIVWVQLGSIVARLGLADALLRFVPPARLSGDDQGAARVVKTALLLAGTAAIALSGFSALLLPAMGGLWSVSPVVVGYMSWFIWTVPLHVVFVLLLMAIQAQQRMSAVVLARDLIQPTLLVGLTAAFVSLGAPMLGLVGGYGLSLAVAIVLASILFVGARDWPVMVAGWMPLPPLLKFSLPIMAADVMHYLYRWFDTLVVGYFLDLKRVAVYNAAMRTSLVISLVALAANAIYATMASGYYHTGETKKLQKSFQLSTRWSLILALPMMVLLIVGADWILLLWGKEFTEGKTTLALLGVAQLVGVPMVIMGYTLLMCNRQYVEVFDTILLLPIVMLLNLLLIPRFGIVGGAISLCVSNALGVSVRLLQVRRFLGIRVLDGKLVKPILAGGVAFLVGEWLHGFVVHTVISGGVSETGGAVLVASIAALGGAILVAFVVCMLVLGVEEEDKAVSGMLLKRR